jgi:hypothetical protein
MPTTGLSFVVNFRNFIVFSVQLVGLIFAEDWLS